MRMIAESFQLWTLGLCTAVSVVIITLTAVCWMWWKRRPGGDNDMQDNDMDPAQRVKVHDRLAQLAMPTVGDAAHDDAA
jgi:uncharacterized iron-regulated membrane protein